MNLGDLTLFTVTYNRTVLTKCMIKSFYKYFGQTSPILVIDNGTIPVDVAFKSQVHVIDNTFQNITGEYHQCSKNHCSTIDYSLKHYINTKWCLLVDNDILFKPAAAEFIHNFDTTAYDCAGEVGWDDAPPNRLFPYFCLINVEKFNSDKLSYFDNDRCIGPGSREEGPRGPNTKCWYQDTGCSFYEDIQSRWKIQLISLQTLIVHMKCTGGGNTNYGKFLYDNQTLFL